MSRCIKLLAFAYLLLVSAALADEQPRQRLDMIVRPECLAKPLHFTDCDFTDAAHPKCKKMDQPTLKNEGCADIQIVHLK